MKVKIKTWDQARSQAPGIYKFGDTIYGIPEHMWKKRLGGKWLIVTGVWNHTWFLRTGWCIPDIFTNQLITEGIRKKFEISDSEN